MMSSLPAGKFQPMPRVSTSDAQRVRPAGSSERVAFPGQEPEVALRRGDAALERRVEQVALRVAAEAVGRRPADGRGGRAGHPGLVRPGRGVGRIVRVEDRPDLVAVARRRPCC